MTRAAVLGRETTDIVVSPGGWHLDCVQIRDLPNFIGSMMAAATGPYIPPGTYFLADGAQMWSSAASPMCSDLRDRCGAAAAAYAAGRIHPLRRTLILHQAAVVAVDQNGRGSRCDCQRCRQYSDGKEMCSHVLFPGGAKVVQPDARTT